MKKNDFDEATRDIKQAIKLDPQNKNLRAEWENLKKAREGHKVK